MKFKEGYPVEVIRRADESCGSWFPGSVISSDGNYYLVRYDSVTDEEGESVAEKVHKKNVRPRPPLRKGKRWVIGDVAEMFEIHCWRVGKIVKVLKNNVFVVKLVGSIQLKEFHGYDIRIQQSWRENKWSISGKVAHNEEVTKYYHQKIGRIHLEDGDRNVKIGLCARKIRASHAYQKPLKRNLPCSKLVLNFSSKIARADERFREQFCRMDSDSIKGSVERLDTFSKPIESEDSFRCSVGSCSSNSIADSPVFNCGKLANNTDGNSDAESSIPSFPVIKHFTAHFEQDLEADIHELEFRAYKSTVQALYASGPLSWEQETLLTNLRLSLHISDEEHLQQLRHLLSTQVL